MLKANDLVRTFRGPVGTVRALDGASLEVAAGEAVVVRGPSGCGKTTLLLTVGALLRPAEGTVVIKGRNPYELPSEERARLRADLVGFMFQQFHLIPYLTVMENVLTPALAGGRPDARERAQEVVARLGLAGRARHVPAELSVGERQRTALARALMNRPRLLLADEPTGNLDDANAELVLRCLAELAESGSAVLIVAHDARARQYARRILEMDAGKIRPS